MELSPADDNTEVLVAQQPEVEKVSALAEFQAYMAEHGEKIVESPRLPGVPLPLQSLMNACPEPITEENAHKFLAEAKALIAAAEAKELETEDEDEEGEAVEEEPASDSDESKKKLI